MRDIVYLRENAKALMRQLYPTGRAWQGKGDTERAIEVKSRAIADYLYEIEEFVSTILPDNDLFTEQDAINWERRLGLDYDPDSLTLEERKSEILRKLSFPGGFKSTLTLEFLEYQLRASSFDVHVYRNTYLAQPAGTELIANSVDKEDAFTVNNFHYTFIIAGDTIDTPAVIEPRRREEFIRKVLRYKPMHMVCFLRSNISKQDGTFSFKYSDYVCEMILDTPPYATNVGISGILKVGSAIIGTYTYGDFEGDPEFGSTYAWYRADDSAGTNREQIAGALNKFYTLTDDDIDKYIQFSVTPANAKDSGPTKYSDYVGPVIADVNPTNLLYSAGSNVLTWQMSDGSENSGTWQVEYRVGATGLWHIQTGGGSPRTNVLPIGTYNNDVYFRVKRISSPTTDYSDIISSYIETVS